MAGVHAKRNSCSDEFPWNDLAAANETAPENQVWSRVEPKRRRFWPDLFWVIAISKLLARLCAQMDGALGA
jgi:hypothetical protein